MSNNYEAIIKDLLKAVKSLGDSLGIDEDSLYEDYGINIRDIKEYVLNKEGDD